MTTPETADASFRLRLFGPMQALVDGNALPPMRSRKGLWLLALLTLRHDRPVEREWLAGTLWPDVEQSQAFANLRPILSELRNSLGSQKERLQSPDRHTLRLDLAGADVDLIAFDAAIANKNLTALEQAATLYQGSLLEGCAEEWVFQERNQREQDCLHALQQLGDAALTAREYAKAIHYYQKAAAIDPFLEVARRGWMEALAQNGDRNAALQVYREFAALLRSNLHAAPDERTNALYARLRAEARQQGNSPTVVATPPAPAPTVTGYLPHPLTDLVGREDERAEVASRLRRSRLVTLTGMGGIGKTRLSLEVAGEVVHEYADGVWLVALDALTEGKQVLPQIASVLGVKEEAQRELMQSLAERLRNKRLLLVLDNCEHLLQASAQAVGPILRESEGVRVLATSREALGITGEIVWAVPCLAVPDPAHLPQGQATLLRVLTGYESVQLFVERAQSIQKTFLLNAENARMVAEVCFRLEGIPLAIELAAARIKAMTVEQIAARLNNELGLLIGGSRTAQSRQLTLRATLDWSYALLSEPERILLRRLSVFAGGWALEAAEQVCGEEREQGTGNRVQEKEGEPLLSPFSFLLSPADVLNLLTSLVDKSLVAFGDQEGTMGGRYRLLEPVRQYAAEQLQAGGEAEQARARHRDWFLALAEEATLHLRGSGQRQWLQRLDREYDNLRAALAWSAADAQGAEVGLRLTGALWRFWYVRGDYSEGRRYLWNALEREGAQERTPARALALNGAGALAYDQADYMAARALFEEGLSIGRQLEDRRGVAGSLRNLGNVALAFSENATAQALYEESLALSRKLEDRHSIAVTLSNLGIVARHEGDYAASRTLFEESLGISKNLGDQLGMARAFLNLGNVARQQGDVAVSQNFYEESLGIYRELGDRQGIARCLGSLGSVAHGEGKYELARVLQEESLRLFRELDDRQAIALALGNLGAVAYEQTDYASARSLYKESLSLLQKLGDKAGAVESLEGLAAVLSAQTETQKAAMLWGGAEMQRKMLGMPLPLNQREQYDKQVAQARAVLGEEAFTAAWEAGSVLPLEHAVDYALGNSSLPHQSH